jgi:hypothetical protein
MLIYFIWLGIPILGAARNYAKYHTFNPKLFIRTPVLNGGLYLICRSLDVDDSTAVLLSALTERWVLLTYKMGLSIYYDDFTMKKSKYILKGHIKA